MTRLPHRLPRLVEQQVDAEALLDRLSATAEPLRPGGTATAPRVALSDGVIDALRSAAAARRLVRGLEDAGAALAAEQRGLDLADRASGAARGERVSRLLFLPRDIGDNFARRVEALLARHGHRVLAVVVNAGARELARPLFGEESEVRLVMVKHKAAVASALVAIARDLDVA